MFLAVILTIIILGILGSIVLSYSNILKKCSQANDTLKGLQEDIKKRYEIIPNILALAHKFLTQDSELVKTITRMRTEALNLFNKEATAEEKINFDVKISEKMHELFFVAENCNQLKSNENFLSLCDDYLELTEGILNSKKDYNDEIENWVKELKRFPNSIAKSMFKIDTSFSLLEVENLAEIPEEPQAVLNE